MTPEMYGAVGNGAVDDTEALQACADTGLPIKMYGGKTYIISDSILFRYKSIIHGNNSCIKYNSNTRPTWQCMLGFQDSTEIFNLKLDGNHKTNFGGRVYSYPTDYVYLYCCEFTNFTNRDIGEFTSNDTFESVSAFYCGGTCKAFTVLYCKVDNCYNSYTGEGYGSHSIAGFSCAACHTATIKYNTISNIINDKVYPGYDMRSYDFHDADGVNLKGGSFITDSECIAIVEHNNFYNCSGRCIKLQMPGQVNHNIFKLDNILLLQNFRAVDIQFGGGICNYNYIEFGNILKYDREVYQISESDERIVVVENIQSGSSAIVFQSVLRSVLQGDVEFKYNRQVTSTFIVTYFITLSQAYSPSGEVDENNQSIPIPFNNKIKSYIEVEKNKSQANKFIQYHFEYVPTFLSVHDNITTAVPTNFIVPQQDSLSNTNLFKLSHSKNYRTSGVSVDRDGLPYRIEYVEIQHDSSYGNTVEDGFIEIASNIYEIYKNTSVREALYIVGKSTFRGTTTPFTAIKFSNMLNLSIEVRYAHLKYGATVLYNDGNPVLSSDSTGKVYFVVTGELAHI